MRLFSIVPLESIFFSLFYHTMMKNSFKTSLLLAFACAALAFQSCALSHTVGSITTSKRTVFTNKQIFRTPTTQQVTVRVEQFVDERPAAEMLRTERAKTAIGNRRLDQFTYGENHRDFAESVRRLFFQSLVTSMAFSGVGDGMLEIFPPQVLVRGRIKSYYGYLESLNAGLAGAVSGEVASTVLSAAQAVPSGGNVEIELQFVDRRTNAVLYTASLRGTAPNEDKYIPRTDDPALLPYEYVDNSIFVDAFNDFTKQLMTVDLASKVSK